MNHHESALRTAFLQCGWSPEQPPAIASKTFDTACTPKCAFVYLHPSGSLSGSYESEGRNALAGQHWRVITSVPEHVHEQVATIDREICASVDATYARGLWLKGVRPRQGQC